MSSLFDAENKECAEEIPICQSLHKRHSFTKLEGREKLAVSEVRAMLEPKLADELNDYL